LDAARTAAASAPLAFGDDLEADLYYPQNTEPGRTLPLVAWLPPFSYATGYFRGNSATFAVLTRRGYAALAFDQIGCWNARARRAGLTGAIPNGV
jgi:hypothetical protein